jgi:hypothetical protein
MHDVRSHQWDCRYNTIVVDTVFGIECVNPVDAWMQCARKLDCDDLVALAEAIMHGDSYVDIDDFDMQALELPYRPFRGQRRCEEAFPQIRSDSDSLPETHLRLNLIHYGLPHPVVNYEPSGLTWTKNGPMKFDLAYPQQKLLIEYDGEHHQILHDQIDNDIEKRSRAVAAGWSVLTFNKHNFNQAPQLVDEFFLRTNTY